MNKIIGRIDDGYDYEFQVIIPRDDGDYDWVTDFENGFLAEKLAIELGGIVAHDVRIAYKQKRNN